MKKVKILLIFICLILLIISGKEISLSYKTDTVMNYDGKEKSFTYYNTNNTDLFYEFKELMPGDIKKQNIIINLDNIDKKTSMYLSISNSSNNMELLNKLNIKIFKDNNVIYDNKNEYEEYIKLHEFTKEESFDLVLQIEVPKELGNGLQDLTSDFKWKFLVEENGELIEVPKTYDDSNIIFNYIVMFTSLIMIFILLLLKKKENKKEDN